MKKRFSSTPAPQRRRRRVGLKKKTKLKSRFSSRIKIGLAFVAIGVFGLILPFLPLNIFRNAPTSYIQGKEEIPNRLLIPKIGVDMPLFLSDNSSVLERGGWILSSGSTPDRVGNTIIFGHRFRYLPPIQNTFYKLNGINKGDEFQIWWEGIEYKYKVIEVKIVEPDDLSVLAPARIPIVTLITCTPLFSEKERLVVIGEITE